MYKLKLIKMEKKKDKKIEESNHKMITIRKEIYNELTKMKTIPQEPYGDLIKRLVDFFKKNTKEKKK